MTYYLESFLNPDTMAQRGADFVHTESLYLHVLRLYFEVFSGKFCSVQHEKPGWQNHLDALTAVYMLRREFYEVEPFTLFLHHLYTIDAYTTLTAGGTGTLITTLASIGLPSPHDLSSRLQYSISSSFPSRISGAGEKLVAEELAGIFKFHQKTVILASKIGLAGQRLRAAKVNEQAQFFEDFGLDKMMESGGEFDMDAQERRDEVKKLEAELKALWENEKPPTPQHKSPDKPELDERVRELFYHVGIPSYSFPCLVFVLNYL